MHKHGHHDTIARYATKNLIHRFPRLLLLSKQVKCQVVGDLNEVGHPEQVPYTQEPLHSVNLSGTVAPSR